jgi:16S rRNA (adenine1518-N6/adenine1519-N6)-dimethyltransferase
MGQNFLVDANIPDKIVRLSGVDESCVVLEVGPGLGALTLVLSRAAGYVVAVELDPRLLPVLRGTLSGLLNVEIVQGDILKLDIVKLFDGVDEKMPGLRRHVCANLPYNITTPALTSFISAGVFESITVMVQREVALRICAMPGTPEYGAFSVFANYHTEPEILFDVPPECFFPRPAVVSSVVTMSTCLHPALEPDEQAFFFRVVRAAFGQRRKTLVNALFSSFGGVLHKEAIAQCVVACGFDAQVRGEMLGVSEFIRLSALVKLKVES